jgi:cytidylate kinase-like protein
MIRIITVEREYGAGGGVVAAKLAERLGWTLWDQRLTDEIARRLDCDSRTVADREERRDPAHYRLFKAFLHGSFEGNLNAPRLRPVDADCIREVTQQVVTEVAEAGNCVIVGRGSAYYLGGRGDAFHVFVYAPFEDKVRRLVSTGKSREEASELAETVDRDRAAFIERTFQVQWPARHRFHLMVNSGLGEDVAVQTILDTAARFGERRV